MAKPREKFKTYGDVFDNFTVRLLFKLSSQGHFVEDSLSPLFIGKESNVFTAMTEEKTKVVIKIYRLETCDFNRMYEYIRLDPRFEGMARRRRMVVFTWAKREYRNLLKLRESIRVPTPIACDQNILIMEMIGTDSPAPKLKDVALEDPQLMFDKVIASLKKMYFAGYVHGDLSEFNILVWDGEPVFIDFSQTMPSDANQADEFFARDVRNLCRFFKKHRIQTDPEQLILSIMNDAKRKA